MILCFGHVHLTQAVIQHCLTENITLVWLSRSGQFLGCLQSPFSGHPQLTHAQVATRNNSDQRTQLARFFHQVQDKQLPRGSQTARPKTKPMQTDRKNNWPSFAKSSSNSSKLPVCGAPKVPRPGAISNGTKSYSIRNGSLPTVTASRREILSIRSYLSAIPYCSITLMRLFSHGACFLT